MKRTKNCLSAQMVGLSFSVSRNSLEYSLGRSHRRAHLAQEFALDQRGLTLFCRWIGLFEACCRRCSLGTAVFPVVDDSLRLE